jgi:subtilisin family serine protease
MPRDDRRLAAIGQDDSRPRTRDEVYRRIAVRFKEKEVPVPGGPFDVIMTQYQLEEIPDARIEAINVRVYRTRGPASEAAEALAFLNKESGPKSWEYAEGDRLVRLHAGPDPRFDEQWAWRRMESDAGWGYGRGAANVTVAVVDSGLTKHHEDLSLSPGSAPGDRDGHGTMLAGTIGAVAGNALGVAGAASPVKLIGVQFFDVDTWPTVLAAAKAIGDAATQGAEIINASWDVGYYSQVLRDAIDDAGKHGVLVVAAAGNGGSDNDKFPTFPASYDLPNLIAVMATDEADDAAAFSNFGLQRVHVGAPGVGILSTYPYDPYPPPTPQRPYVGYRFYSGTSPAAAHVSGLAALLKQRNKGWTPAMLRGHIIASVDAVRALRKKCASGGRVNFRRALCGPLRVLKPRAHDRLTNGTVVPVFWGNDYQTPACQTLSIKLEEVGTSTIHVLATHVPNNGQFHVKLPGNPIPKARIRIVSEQGDFHAASEVFEVK